MDKQETESENNILYDYISKYAHLHLKFKSDKWVKMMANDEYKSVIQKFLTQKDYLLLLITCTSDGILLPYLEYTSTTKSKSIFFIKAYPSSVTDENKHKLLIIGDCNANIIQHLRLIVNEIFATILLNPCNHINWSSVLEDDVKRNVYNLKENIRQIQNIMQGRTLLLIPEHIELICRTKMTETMTKENIDIHIKNSIELTVSNWISQMLYVISESSETLFAHNAKPTVNTEIKFWENKLENIQGILNQLQEETIQNMSHILQTLESPQYMNLKELHFKISRYKEEIENIKLFLKPLQRQTENLEKTDYKYMKKNVFDLVQILFMIWANCYEIRQMNRFTNIIKEVCNSFLFMSCRYLNPSAIFQEDAHDVMTKISTVIDTLSYFKELFFQSQTHLSYYTNVNIFWNINNDDAFEKFNTFLNRVSVTQNFFSTVLQYKELEKMEFSGAIGYTLSLKVIDIFERFTNLINRIYEGNYNPLDMSENIFLEEYVRFTDQIADMDKQLANIFSKAFGSCYNMDSFFKLVLMLGKLLHRPAIRSEVEKKYNLLLAIFDQELEAVKMIYHEAKKQYSQNGAMNFVENFPPFSGSLLTLLQMKQRVLPWSEMLNFIETNALGMPDITQHLKKYNELLYLLEDVESEISEKWLNDIPYQIENNLNKSLIIIHSDNLLELNFTKELAAALKETRYIKLLKYEQIPESVESLYERSEELYQVSRKLHCTITQYNEIHQNSKSEEFELIENELQHINSLINEIQHNLTWNSDLQNIISNLYQITNALYEKLTKTQSNLHQIQQLINQWNEYPLFVRYDDTGLIHHLNWDSSEIQSIVNRRYKDISKVSEKVCDLLKENLQLFCNAPKKPEANRHLINISSEPDFNSKSMPTYKSKMLRMAKKSLQARKIELKINKTQTPTLPDNEATYNLEEFGNIFGSDDETQQKYKNYLILVEMIVRRGLLTATICSMNYLVEEMKESKQPLFQIRMELQETSIKFYPEADYKNDSNLMSHIVHMITYIENMIDIVPHVIHTECICEKLEEDFTKIRNIKTNIVNMVEQSLKEAKILADSFEQYNYLWLDNMDECLRQFLLYGRQLTVDEQELLNKPNENNSSSFIKETSLKLDDFKTQIDSYNDLQEEINKLSDYKIIDNWLKVDLRPFKDALLNLVEKWSMLFKQYLIDQVNNSLYELKEFITDAEKGLMQPLDEGEYSNLVKVMSYLVNVRDRAPDTDFMFEPLQEIVELLVSYDIEFNEETYRLMQELPDHWNNTKRLCISAKSAAAPFIQAEVNIIRKRIVLFDIKQTVYKDVYKNKFFFKWHCEYPYKEIDTTHDEISRMENMLFRLSEQANLFEIAQVDFKTMQTLRKDLKLAKILWDYIFLVNSWFSDWKETRWKEINSETMDIELKKFSREIKTLDKDVKEWEIYLNLETIIKDMITALRAITELQNPAIRQRHWDQLMIATKENFEINDTTTLTDLLELNLHQYEEEVKTIVDKSVKEMSMEKSLKEFEAVWSNMEFKYEMHPCLNIQLIKCSEDVIEKLEDNQIQLQNMMSSKFIAYFLEEVSEWQQTLANADQLINIWLEVQRTWLYLQSIFVGSDDICSQFPEDSRRFLQIDSEFRSLLDKMLKSPNILQASKTPKLYENLEKLQMELTKCEKALSKFLETKRLIYPRFYFISPVDLLDILANGNQPEMVSRHLTKLYDSIAKLKFMSGNNERHIARGMYAKDGEYVEFVEKCECTGHVEKWLNNVTKCMKETGRKYLAEAVLAYDEKPREQWLFDYPAQTALCATQIWWTSEVNMAFTQMEEGYENALKDYNKKQITQLNQLISLLLSDLSAGDRQKIMTICTIDVHSRDVVSRLISEGIETSSAFQWQSQLRHRWDTGKNDCFANICDAEFRYNHEYLGNTSRLVITPLTDRCYITLTQSLHLVMGGAAAGPAGTGKTETTKDLGKALGMMVYVFNCSEQMDYKSCWNIYKGLAQTGAWGCFDEFNRIAVEVLSVVAVQVKCILDALKSKKSEFNFLGENISLVPTVGMFITMNPGYAGRTELPENLKTLYRPCAMIVPDFELICEIMLITEGFQNARTLARKFITLYSLCKELLSKQDHYDWGLRAIKSLLVMAGSLKRADPNRPEEEILMRALRDFNIPKIVTDDVPIFMSLIHDLFPMLDVPRKQDFNFETQAKLAALDLKLQPEENFILKVVQLKELLNVRHSVFIVGSAGSGKTQIWKTLHRTYINAKLKPHYSVIEPKAVTNDELFGIINPATREWKDGLFSALIREQTLMSGSGPKWMIMDGDIDPMWIESLNTVMDDNKVLTLASNERIYLTQNMWLIFEISNLHSATPATVSRAGILYINSQDLGWSPYVTSWIETRTNESEKANLTVLFDKYVPAVVEVCRTKFKKIIPIPEITCVQMLCSLLECLLVPTNVPRDCPKEWYEIYFVFACVWAFGSALYQDQVIDYRSEFTKWWTGEFKTVKFPPTGLVFNYYVDPKTKKFLPWSDKVGRFELDPDIPLSSSLVSTAETTKIQYFLELLISRKNPVMLVGGSGYGKTILMSHKLASLSDVDYSVTNISLNYYSTSETLQKVLEKPLEKKAGRNYGPSGNKTMIYFIDDLNAPQVDKYGTVQPHTLIRQHLNYKQWYDRSKLTSKDIHNIMFVSCMNPTSGNSNVDLRLQRFFYTFALSPPTTDVLHSIYNSILSQHLRNSGFSFPIQVVRSSDLLVQLTLATHSKITQTFLPTATKFHYVFNLKDLTNLFQGLLFMNPECVVNPGKLVRIWIHEAYRVYSDKLVDQKDKDTFSKLLMENVKKIFPEIPETDYNEKPLIYCHFSDGIGNLKYLPITSWSRLHKLVTEALHNYNELVGSMNLVFFEDAMAHICRINRILEIPRGNIILVGVGGSGKQSLARLAAFISSMETFQIQLKKGYGIHNIKSDFAQLYIKAGLKSISTVFLMTDAQISDEKFLVPINDFLACGEIADLFSDDEVTNIINTVRPEVKSTGIADTRENCWKFFIERVRRHLKIVLCFSPVGPIFRNRGRKFPAIMNCTYIDWFQEWPQEALESVSLKFLNKLDILPSELRKPISLFMANVHMSVGAISTKYRVNDRRYNYTTPKTFLEQLYLYEKLLRQKSNENQANIERFQNGIQRLVRCAEQVDELKISLAEQEIILAEKKEKTEELIKIIEKETVKTKREKTLAADEERKVRIIEEDVAVKQKMCEEDLRNAEPMLVAAKQALNILNKSNLTELKSFGSPPAIVANVTAAVMVLLAKKGKIPKDRSWKACKIMMAKLDSFLDSLINYSVENINPEVVKSIQPYLKNPEFNPDLVRMKSSAAAGLCEWVINIMKYYEIWTIVEPKRKALSQATLEYTAAANKLTILNEKIQALEGTLQQLKEKLEEANNDKENCVRQKEETSEKINLANRLVKGLASESVRWRESITNLEKAALTLPGDILLVSAYISYVGCFTKLYRNELLHKYWLPFLKKSKPEIPISCEEDFLPVLADEAQVAAWNNEGLPNDRMSAENAMVLTHSERWPLMIDPQLQGIRWIKTKYGKNLRVVKQSQENAQEVIEHCISEGEILLFENIEEYIDPIFDNLVGRNLLKKGRTIKIDEKEIDFNTKFRLILHTKLGNPHYKPEIQAQTTLINFTVTKDGLEDQLLAEVMKAERPDLEQHKSNLTKEQNDYKIKLKLLEDELLQQLSSAEGDVLGDKRLVENLESSKKMANEIVEKVSESRMASIKIDEAREQFRLVATRASILYFIMNDLYKINPIYQFSLKSFSGVFQNAIVNTRQSNDLQQHINDLIDAVSYDTFTYINMGLFQDDRLTFLLLMTIQILTYANEINTEELDFLLRFPTMTSITSPVDFLTNKLWGGIKNLSMMDEFRGLDKDIEGSAKRWKKFVEGETPEREKLPQEWKNKTGLQKLCIIRALRPDRMSHAIKCFVEEKLGAKYTEARSADFAEIFKKMDSTTPIFFILSAGVDPTRDVEALGTALGYTTENENFHNISLGQGQEALAETAIEEGYKQGHWVMLQNIHLVKSWLPILDKKLETSFENPHPNYRLFMSAESATSPQLHIIPQGILESSIKITNEPPTGVLSNLHKALDNFDQETLETCSKEVEFKTILFTLCYFHACIAERRKFGPQGWNQLYPFNVGDLIISVHVLYNYLESSFKIPWEDLRYLFGEIMYGGHITDDWDRKLCRTYLQEFLCPQLLEGETKLAPGFPAPSNMDYQNYHRYIDEMLPPESPILYGLHPNAEIGFLTNQAENLFKMILELQPRDFSSSGIYGMSRDDKVRQTIDEILDKIPNEFNLQDMAIRAEERTPYTTVVFQECERMNVLMAEIKYSLIKLNLGLKGELTITPDMEEVEEAIFLDKVPQTWEIKAYPSMLGLSAWFSDLLCRLKELEAWVADFCLPSSVWLGGLFNPQAFLTAVMQSAAHKNEWPLDKMTLHCEVTKKQKDEFTTAPRDGVYINGLYMEGARWDVESGYITDSKLKELFSSMPVIYIKGITIDKQDTRNMYECPIYRTRQRGPTYISSFNLKTKEKPSKWIIAGAALLLSI